MSESFCWDVVAPQRRTHAMAKMPQGSVRIQDEEAGTEYISVPAPVARILAKEKKTGEYSVTCKKDLMILVSTATQKAARERVSRLIARRDYAAQEVVQKLEQDGFSKDVIRATVRRSVEIGLVNDERFADAYIRGKVFAGWGMERIAKELSRRGVDVHTLDGWPYEYLDPEEEYDRALQAALRKRVKEPNAYAKMARFLVGRGYSYGVATRAAEEALHAMRSE